MIRISYRAYLVSTCLVALTVAGPVAAQGVSQQPAHAGVPATSDTTDAAITSGDIVVTAQRRSESLSRTPVSVSVLSSETLTKLAITTESDLQTVSPGLTVRASQNSNQLNYAIRGQSLDAFSGTRPGVLPYEDEVQVGGGGGASAFYDLQSIQVLKGPQGTLFGRNATGGAVLFTTVKPTNELTGYISAGGGDYNHVKVEGAINVPLVKDKVLVRVAGFYEKRDGYQYDVYQNHTNGDVDRYGLRGSLTIKPVDGLENDLVVDYYHAGGNNINGVLYSLNRSGAIPTIALTNFGNVAQFEGIISAFAGPGAGTGQAAVYAAAHPRLDPGGLASFLVTQKARGPYISASNGPNSYLGHNLIISNITSIDINENTKIRNIIGFTKIYSNSTGDYDGSPYGLDESSKLSNNTKQFSEELQLVGTSLEDKLKYVTGVYYSNEKNTYINKGNILTFPVIASLQSYTAKAFNTTYAAYAQGTYDLSSLVGIDGLAATGGIRYTSEKVAIQTLPDDESHSDPAAAQARYQFYQSTTYRKVSWTLGLQEQVNPNLLLYAASRRSYRNGGYNNSERPVPGPGTLGGNGYNTETVTDAEIGLKYAGHPGGIPLRANLALYQDWIRNNQRVAYAIVGGAPAAITVNVPRAEVRGFEFDGTVTPASWFQIGGALTYTDAKFTDNRVSIAGGSPVIFGTYPDTPKWSETVFAEVTVPISSELEASLRADEYAQSHTYYTSSGNTNPGARLPGYALTNFRVGLTNKNDGWSLSINLKNAFNRVYYVGGIALGELFQENTAVPGNPRTFLAEVRYKF